MSLVLSLNTLHRERRMSVQVTESSVVKSASRWVRCRYPIAGESSWQETLLHHSRRKIQVQKGAHDVVRPSETLSPLTYMGLPFWKWERQGTELSPAARHSTQSL